MSTFFSSAGPAKEVTHGSATFGLPILYFRDDAFTLFYTADPQKVKNLLPSDKLHPILLPGNRTMVGVAAFNYIDTTIGSYGEVGLVIPVVHADKAPSIILPAILESRYTLVLAFLSCTCRSPRALPGMQDAANGDIPSLSPI